jgi:hypothetical protein
MQLSEAMFDVLPFTAPIKVGDYPADAFKTAEGFKQLRDTHQAGALELMRRTEGALMPTAYLHLRRDPYVGTLEDALWSMSIKPEMKRGFSDGLIRSLFKTTLQLIATLGEARGVAMYLQALSFKVQDHESDVVDYENMDKYDLADRECVETLLVSIETESKHRMWIAPFARCRDCVIHPKPFIVAPTELGRAFAGVMEATNPSVLFKLLATLRTSSSKTQKEIA